MLIPGGMLAGITMERCSGLMASVYTGTFTNDYQSVMMQDTEAEHRYSAAGLSCSMLANRISWFFNFHGPSMNIDSACSSSLTAVHLACQDLRTGATSMVIKLTICTTGQIHLRSCRASLVDATFFSTLIP